MATVRPDSIPHLTRTQNDKRERDMHSATIGRIEKVNSKTRLFRLYIDDSATPVRHLPGQYVDLYIPELDRVGGFTITSPPQAALRKPAPTPSTTTPPSAATFDDPYIELAVQRADDNPPAKYLWGEPEDIMYAPLKFRVGGEFTYPPMGLSWNEFQLIDNVVLIAGGVGINPLMSILSAMDALGTKTLGGVPRRLRLLYASKRLVTDDGSAEEILFEKRLSALAEKYAKNDKVDFGYTFFDTSSSQKPSSDSSAVMLKNGRMTHKDILESLGPESQRQSTLVYVCGLPAMTDDFVSVLRKAPGMNEKRVLCEKWW